jgi:hypothetical protein
MSLIRSIRTIFPELSEKRLLHDTISPVISSKGVTLSSWAWDGPKIRRARLCKLEVPDKFFAETLVIYPKFEYNAPILGTEYLRIADKKYFGAIDFHPLSQDQDYSDKYIKEYLYDFPDRQEGESKFYDFTTFFSSKFWLRKSTEDFYSEYIDWADRYLSRYRLCVEEMAPGADCSKLHEAYDTHMATNDPAHGILKAYFSKDFADIYTNEFLFSLSK